MFVRNCCHDQNEKPRPKAGVFLFMIIGLQVTWRDQARVLTVDIREPREIRCVGHEKSDGVTPRGKFSRLPRGKQRPIVSTPGMYNHPVFWPENLGVINGHHCRNAKVGFGQWPEHQRHRP